MVAATKWINFVFSMNFLYVCIVEYIENILIVGILKLGFEYSYTCMNSKMHHE